MEPSKFVIKGQWTEEEDRQLIKLVNQYGERKWTLIAKNIIGRVGKQCRERWHNHLRPDIKKGSWSNEEEHILIEAHEVFGNKWTEIAKRIPGRTENSIKNHWNVTKRRLNLKRNKIKEGRNQNNQISQPSPLEEYMEKGSTKVSTISLMDSSSTSSHNKELITMKDHLPITSNTTTTTTTPVSLAPNSNNLSTTDKSIQQYSSPTTISVYDYSSPSIIETWEDDDFFLNFLQDNPSIL